MDGWMDRALQELYVQDTNGDGWYTDDFARSLKQSTNSDSVMLIFSTHDNKGAYAVGPDKGHGDKAAVSYLGMYSDGRDFPSVPNTYQHEALHFYGALDEYIVEGYTSPSQTYRLKSILSVSPMSEMYENRNHELSQMVMYMELCVRQCIVIITSNNVPEISLDGVISMTMEFLIQ